jgi:hypothetical protein
MTLRQSLFATALGVTAIPVAPLLAQRRCLPRPSTDRTMVVRPSSLVAVMIVHRLSGSTRKTLSVINITRAGILPIVTSTVWRMRYVLGW